MPTRIPPYRDGYGDNPGSAAPGDPPDGYFCVGILRPCIEPMTGTDFECLPKATCKLMTNVPYHDLTALKADIELPVLMESCDERFDPLDGSLRIDLWGALQRTGLDSGIDTGCSYPYISNTSSPMSEGEFPMESESSVQIQYCPGYMDPIIVPFPSIGDGSEIDNEIPSDESEESSGEEDDFEHPFKSRVKPDNPGIIQVGYLRPRFEDHIVVVDQTSDSNIGINFPDVEEIAVSTSAWYIYYDIFKYDAGGGGNGTWVARLEKTNIWPPPCCTEDGEPGVMPYPPGSGQTTGIYNTYTGNIVRLIGYADTNDGVNYTWQQHMYENPTEHPVDPRGQFEAWYVNDGQVYIDGGGVSGFGFGGAVSGNTFDLGQTTDIWVECISTHGSTASIAVTSALQSGTYPGFMEEVDCTTTNFNFLIGQIQGDLYHPAHKGTLEIDNTLFMYDCGASLEEYMAGLCATGGSDQPRVMFFSDDSPDDHKAAVGLNSNPVLYHGHSFAWDIDGGGTYALESGSEYIWYGIIDSDIDDTVDIAGVAGAALTDAQENGTGSFTLTPLELDWYFDHGICQRFDNEDVLEGIQVKAGDNVWIDFANNLGADSVATIHSRGGLDEDSDAQAFDVTGVPGSGFGTGSATITSKKFDWDFVFGHVDEWAVGAGTTSLQIVGGTNVEVDYVGGVATINADTGGGAAHTSVEVVVDLQITGSGAGLVLQMKKRTMEVVNPEAEVGLTWDNVPGWVATVCP